MTYLALVPRPTNVEERDPESLAEALENLQPHALAALEIAALIGIPFTLRRLLEVGRATVGPDFTPSRIQRILEDVISKGLLLASGDDYLCAPPMLEHLAVGAMANGRAAPIVKQLMKLDPWLKSYQGHRLHMHRFFRLYLYSGDIFQAKGIANHLEDHEGMHVWSDVGRRFLNPESFFAFPLEVSTLLAQDTLMQSLNRAFAAPHALVAFGQIAEMPDTKDKLRQLYGHALLMGGHRDAFDDFLDRHDYPMLEGCRKLIDGDVSGLDDFERGLRKSRFFFSYTALFLYLVGLIAKEGFDSPRVRAEVGTYPTFALPFEWLLSVKAGEVADLTDALRSQIRDAHEAIVPHLSVILFWGGFRYPKRDTAQLALDYEKAGYPVFAGWMHWSSGTALLHEPQPPLLGLLQADEGWRKIISAINAWSAPARESVATAERIVWQIEPFTVKRHATPKVQKRAKKGGWSSGRLITIEELCDQAPDFADEHDIKVVAALQRLDLRRAPRSSITDAILLALVGHPRVSLANNPDHMIELTKMPVEVQVRRFTSHIEIALDPQPSWATSVLARPAEPGRILLYHLTDRHAQLGRVIDSNLKIPLEGEDELKEALSGLTTAGLSVSSDIEIAGNAEEIEPDSTLVVRLSPFVDGLSVQVRVAPLGEGGPLVDPGVGPPIVAGRIGMRSLQTKRNHDLEKQRWEEMQAWHPGFLSADFTLVTARESLEFLEGFAGHEQEHFRLEWPEGQRFDIPAQLQLSSLSQRVRTGTDWFALGGDIRVNDDLVLSIGELMAMRKESGSRFLKLSSEKYLALTAELETYLQRLETLAQRHAHGEVVLHPLAGLALLENAEIEADAGWQELKDRLESSRTLEPTLPNTLVGELRDYQVDGVRWLLRLAHWGVGACLADDMGLGKTIQVLAVLLARADLGPALVVAPTSVCWNWAEEAARFAPSLRVISLADSSRNAVLEDLGPGDLLITSYGLLVNEAEGLASVPWSTAVLDEAQAIKNASTKRARAAAALQADFRVAATGTPVENHPDEMWALFRYLNPGVLGSRKSFGSKFVNSARGQEELGRLVRPFILRRTKDQVLKELPPRTEILEKVELSEKERALYESLRRQAMASLKASSDDYVSVLAQLTRLRRVCCHPSLVYPDIQTQSAKLERFHALVDELVENGHRALVFSQFVSFLSIVRAQLDARGISYAYLDGSTPAAARRKAVQGFQEGQGDLFLISLKAGGTGLNLTAADYVIHLDPWWNPAVEDQASDRAHRMGQLRPVTIYRLVAQGTVEEQIVELHGQKRDLAQRLLEGTEGSDRLTASDLMALLQG